MPDKAGSTSGRNNACMSKAVRLEYCLRHNDYNAMKCYPAIADLEECCQAHEACCCLCHPQISCRIADAVPDVPSAFSGCTLMPCNAVHCNRTAPVRPTLFFWGCCRPRYRHRPCAGFYWPLHLQLCVQWLHTETYTGISSKHIVLRSCACAVEVNTLRL